MLNTFLGCFYRESLRFLRTPFQTIFNTVFSSILLGLAFYFYNPKNILFLVPGLIFFSSYQVISSNLRMILFVGRMDGILNYQIIAPISKYSLYLIYIIVSILRAALVVTPLLVLLNIFIFEIRIYNWTLLLFCFFISSLFIANISCILCLYYKDWNSFGSIENYIITPLIFLSGAFYPLSNIPIQYKNIFLLNPFFHFINTLRFASSNSYDINLLLSSMVCLFLCFLTTIICLVLFHKGYRFQK